SVSFPLCKPLACLTVRPVTSMKFSLNVVLQFISDLTANGPGICRQIFQARFPPFSSAKHRADRMAYLYPVSGKGNVSSPSLHSPHCLRHDGRPPGEHDPFAGKRAINML